VNTPLDGLVRVVDQTVQEDLSEACGVQVLVHRRATRKSVSLPYRILGLSLPLTLGWRRRFDVLRPAPSRKGALQFCMSSAYWQVYSPHM